MTPKERKELDAILKENKRVVDKAWKEFQAANERFNQKMRDILRHL